jgi:hypothetical protein
VTKKDAIRINELLHKHKPAEALRYVMAEFRVNEVDAERMVAQARAKASRRNE